MFGSIVIALSLHYGIQFSDQNTAGATEPAQASADGMAEAGTAKRAYSGIGAAANGTQGEVHEAERTNAVLAVKTLNRISGTLDDGVSKFDRVVIYGAVQAGKLSLMRSVWDEANWGAWSEFKVWVNQGEADPAPAAIETAARLFRAGSQNTAQ